MIFLSLGLLVLSSLFCGTLTDVVLSVFFQNNLSVKAHILIILVSSLLVFFMSWFSVCRKARVIFSESEEQTKKKPEGKMKVVIDKDAKMPTRAHEGDAGLDLYAREPAVIPARGSQRFDTGVHIELPPGTTGFLKSKSGLNVNFGITSDGVIDSGYTGSIVVKLYNNSDTPYKVKSGDKISQLVILPVELPSCVLVDALDVTERGGNGFGSSGR